MMRSILIFLFFSVLATRNVAQEMSITGANITQCGGFLVDDGLSSSSYSNNLNAEITVCAPAPETIINLYWAVFALGAGDQMEIFDGPNNTSPSLGVFTGAELQSVDVTSSNPSGCLTVHFISDGTVTGNFGAEISCGPPCERPIAVINTSEAVPLKICPGEEVTFNASNSIFANGAAMQSFTWVFDDGSTNTTSWPTVTHAFNTPGGYNVQLFITDNNDCNSANLPDHVVLVSTYPDFSLLSPQFEMCSGGIDFIGVNFNIPDSIYANDSLNMWISEPWIDLPDINLGGALFIPDDQTQCFSDEVTFSNFDFGQVITDPGQIDNFFINFEHSFIGDITISFICPNNQSVIVHQQGGGGTFAGEPIDSDANLNPGVGYDYYWSPDATNGTWAENSGGTIASGTYESVQSFDQLIGCPLNGTWTVEICDMWPSDNGFIFDWGINFDPELFNDLLSFTPVYGVGCDSTFWTGPGIISQDPGCDFIEIELIETGSYDYTYTVINDFGCTFDTTIVVDIFIAPFVNAGPDVVFACDPVGLQATLEGDVMEYVYQWSPSTNLTNANTASPTLQSASGPITYTLTGYPVGYPGCASSDEMQVILDPSLPFPGTETSVQVCDTSPPFSMIDALEGNPDFGGFWQDQNNSPVSEIFDPALQPAGTYFYTIIYEDCELSAPMNIDIGLPAFTISNDTTVCIGGSVNSTVLTTSDFNGSYTYTWSNGDIGFSASIDNITTEQTLSVIATDAGGCESAPVSHDIFLHPALAIETFADTIICPEGTIDLDVLNVSGGFGSRSYSWTFNNQNIGNTSSFEHDPSSTGVYCVTVSDQCETPSATDCFNLSFEAPMQILFSADTTQGCVPLNVDLTLENDPSSYMLNTLSWITDETAYTSTANPSIQFGTPGSYDLTIQLNSARGCANTLDMNNYFTVFANPVANWYATPQPADTENPGVQFFDLSIGQGLSYGWQIFFEGSELASFGEQEPFMMFPSDQGRTYDVQLLVVDQNNCRDILRSTVVINDIFQVFIPNSFTPNNDGINDVFFVNGADIDEKEFELIIFNRWGDVVFQTNDPHEVWQGSATNTSEYFAPDGLYQYRVKVGSASTTERFEKRGTVLLIR